MKTPLKVDGVEYPNLHIISLKRSFSVLDGPAAGRVLSYDMVRDVGGTFYNYSMTFDPNMSNPMEYDTFYDVISAPVEYHVIEVPYGQGTMIFKAYVTNGDDELPIFNEDINVWENLSVNFIATSPQRRPA